jgi:hypothetical protein
MAANYPSSIKVWTPKVNLQDLVIAEDVNTVYEEIEAMQRQLGVGAGGLSVSGEWGASGDFSSATTSWGSLRSRIQNIENGVFFAASRRGGSVIAPSGASVVGVTVRAASGQTANLLEVRNASNQVVSSFNSSGNFIGTIDGGTA